MTDKVSQEKIIQYKEAIQPLIDAFTNLAMVYIPSMTMYPDGHLETHWPDEYKQQKAEVGHLVRLIRDEIFGYEND